MDSNERQCFMAAVLDHAITSTQQSEDIQKNIDRNFRVYHKATIIAKNNDVDIIVFPEGGLMTGIDGRKIGLEYAIEMPTKFPTETLCRNENDLFDSNANQTILERLSCLAKKYEIFLVAQLLDKQPCNGNPKCREGEEDFLFNTAVLFDRNGKLLAKYHKMQPYGEMSHDPAPNDELIYVDTELGRLGLFICFDLIYKKPGHLMAFNSSYSVDTMILPTHWFDEAPFLSAAQYQMAWAFGNQINLLASNMHLPMVGSVGSGIYNGNDENFISANYWNETTEHLIIGRLPKKPRSEVNKERGICHKKFNKIIKIDLEDINNDNIKNDYDYKHQKNANISLLELEKDGLVENISIEHNGIECRLNYRANFTELNKSKPNNEGYFLLASNRSRPDPSYQWWEQFCVLTYATYDPNDNNPERKSLKYLTNNLNIFEWIKLEGIFDQETVVYPSAVEYNNRPIEPNNGEIWSITTLSDDDNADDETSPPAVMKKHVIIELKNTTQTETETDWKKLSILSLYGRTYQRDPPYKQVDAQGPPKEAKQRQQKIKSNQKMNSKAIFDISID